jgi:hypothetical protein
VSTQPVNPGRPPQQIDAYPLLWWVMGLLIAVLILAAFLAI